MKWFAKLSGKLFNSAIDGIWFLSHVVAQAEKKTFSLPFSHRRYILSDSAKGKIIF